MWADDGQLQLLRELPGTAGVVNVGMGQPDGFQREAELLYRLF